jgi:hypothetical protein
MKAAVVVAAVALALLGMSCAGTAPNHVPVMGAPTDVSQLAGEWDGDYSSIQTQRYGTIYFSLRAASDTATGQIMMIPRAQTSPASGAPPVAGPPQSLTIRFVNTIGDSVAGVLDPYTDPSCACTVQTVFRGRVNGEDISGTYETRNNRNPDVTGGQWRVHRRKRP